MCVRVCFPNITSLYYEHTHTYTHITLDITESKDVSSRFPCVTGVHNTDFQSYHPTSYAPLESTTYMRVITLLWVESGH
jgi:hypothetical protein